MYWASVTCWPFVMCACSCNPPGSPRETDNSILPLLVEEEAQEVMGRSTVHEWESQDSNPALSPEPPLLGSQRGAISMLLCPHYDLALPNTLQVPIPDRGAGYVPSFECKHKC